jgi:hypothetical protein
MSECPQNKAGETKKLEFPDKWVDNKKKQARDFANSLRFSHPFSSVCHIFVPFCLLGIFFYGEVMLFLCVLDSL